MLLNQTKKSVKIFSLILSLIMIFSVFSVSSYAVTDAEKAEYEKKIEDIKSQIKENEQKIKELKEEASTYDGDISALQEKIDVLQSQIDLYDEEIALIDADIAVIDNQIQSIEQEIDELNKQIDELDKQVLKIQQEIADTYTLLGERIRVAYMSGANSTLEYLLTSDDFEFQSYLERAELLQRIAEHDDALITELEENIENLKSKMIEIEDMKTRLNSKIEELDEVKAEHEAKKQEQVDARKVIQDAEDEIQADLDKVMSVVNSLNSKSKEYEAAIEKGESAILEYENKLASQNDSYGSGVVSGNMIWPLPYSNTYVSSSFKMRTLNGVTKQHNGIDICRWGGTSGANIVAVKDGTVEVAYHSGYNGGFGLYVVINHGNGVKTYYAHMSNVSVNVGDYVTQGRVIGQAGNTGYSFGAHLHFGVMVNGSWQNPMNYLTKPSGLQ
ncbi:MAG: peptidoglycan DD-metalloendopeptidase family protein, partial [Oscillospiraceae bacterium]|nr:peptidoglycan DD-metalloendopeptidase family protein [Oscillospiraceae bacterium]